MWYNKITTWNVVSTAVFVFNKSVSCIFENDKICQLARFFIYSVLVDVQKELVFVKMFSIFPLVLFASCMLLSVVSVNAKKYNLRPKNRNRSEMLLQRIDKNGVTDVLL